MMKFLSNRLLALSMAALLAMAGSAAAQNAYGRKLGDAEIRKLAPGEFAGNYKGKLKLVIHLKPGGKITGTANGKPQQGRWRVKGDELCLTVRFLILSKTRCGPIFYDGSRYFGMFNKRGKPRLMLQSVSASAI